MFTWDGSEQRKPVEYDLELLSPQPEPAEVQPWEAFLAAVGWICFLLGFFFLAVKL